MWQCRNRGFAWRVPRVTLALVLVSTAAAGPVRAQQQEQERTITMQEAVDLALQVSPAMAQRVGAVTTSEWGERVAWGAFLPTLSMSSGASVRGSQRFNEATGQIVNVDTNESYSAGLSAGMDVFTAGRRGAQRRQARAATTAAEAAVVEQRFAVTLSAKSAFFQVLRADELIRVAETQVERAQKGLEAAQQRLAVGSATRSDSLRARLEVNQAEQALLQARTQRRAAAYALGALTGLEGSVGGRLETPLEPRPITYDEAALVDMAVGSAPVVRSAEADVIAADAALSASRTQYFPMVRASAGYNLSNTEPSFSTAIKGWNTGLSLSYPLFNGFSREDANTRASVNRTVARTQFEDTRRQVRANLVQALDQVRMAEQQLELSEEALMVAQEDMRVQEERYRLGASTILDLITSQIALAQADQSRVNARYDYQIARAELEALVGREL